MPSRKPTQERIEQVKAQFQAVESKVLEFSSGDSSKEKHFRLPYSAALEAVDADLSKTAYRLWIYLSANYPFGDCDVDLPSQTELGIRLGVTRQAVNIAAAELQAAGLWDFWSEKWKGRNLRGFNSSADKDVKKSRQVSKKDDTLSKKSDTGCQKEMTGCQKKMTPYDLKALPEAGSTTPHTIQTYSNFIHTLSDSEREIFLEFSRKKAANLPHPPELPDKWIAANFAELYKQFVASNDGKKAKKALVAQQDWKAHPQFEEWLWKAYSEGYAWIHEKEEEREQRNVFMSWCRATDAFAVFETDAPY